MTTLLIASVLALTAPQQPPGGAQPQDRAAPTDKALDGQWTIVCLEKNGQPMPEAKAMTVKCEGNTITCSAKDGKPAMTLKVVFGQNGTLKVTEQNAEASPAPEPGRPADTAGRDPASASKSGVYVLTSDFLAVCIHDTAARGADRNGSGDTTAADRVGGGSNPSAKSYCSIILKREGTAPNK